MNPIRDQYFTGVNNTNWQQRAHKSYTKFCTKVSDSTLKVINFSNNVYNKHSDLIQQIALLALNITVFATRVFKQIPPTLQRLCYNAFTFVGIINLKYGIDDLSKTIKDLKTHINAKDIEGIFFTAAKVAFKATNILLQITCFSAGLISLLGTPQIALSIYLVTRPISICSLVVEILTTTYDYKKNKALCNEYIIIQNQPEKIQAVVNHFLKLINNEHDASPESEEKALARHSFCQLKPFSTSYIKKMHKHLEVLTKIQESLKGQEILKDLQNIEDTPERLRAFIENLNPEILSLIKNTSINRSTIDSKIIQEIKKTLQLNNTGLNIDSALSTFGYICMIICKIFPDTLTQSSLHLTTSFLYTAKMIWKKVTLEKMPLKMIPLNENLESRLLSTLQEIPQ